jgi:hypothetical protein
MTKRPVISTKPAGSAVWSSDDIPPTTAPTPVPVQVATTPKPKTKRTTTPKAAAAPKPAPTPKPTPAPTPMLSSEALTKVLLKDLVSTFYQIQTLRIQLGNRLTAHFYRKLGVDRTTTLLSQRQGDNKAKIELIDVMKSDWKRITDAFADVNTNKQLKSKMLVKVATAAVPEEDKNEATRRVKEKIFPILTEEVRGVFDDFLEWNMMAEYRKLILAEDSAKKDMENCLQKFRIWTEWLGNIKGVGPTIGAVIVSTIDIHKADTPASIWAYAGLDVVIINNDTEQDGRGRGRYKEHLVEYDYIAKDGSTKQKVGITFNPQLKTKLVGVLADIMIKQRTPKYREEYDNYKARITEREVVLTQQAAERGDTDFKPRTPAHLHRMALRYMIKRFLVTLYYEWRTIEGLEVTEEYGVRKLGLVHHNADGRWARQSQGLSNPVVPRMEMQLPPSEVGDDETPELF